MFWKKIESRYQREEDPWVKASYEMYRYLSGDESALFNLQRIIYEHEAPGDYLIQTAAFHGLTRVRNIFNERKINQIVADVYPRIDATLGLKREMEDFLKTREVPNILILDKENAGLVHILRYLVADMEKDMWVETAGLSPAEMTKEEVRKKVGEDDIFNKYYYPINIRNIWYYDYIVPLGIKADQEDYPFQRVVPLFENVDENMLDVKMAEGMIKELKEYIDNDVKREMPMKKMRNERRAYIDNE